MIVIHVIRRIIVRVISIIKIIISKQRRIIVRVISIIKIIISKHIIRHFNNQNKTKSKMNTQNKNI